MEDVVRSFFQNLNGFRQAIPRTTSGTMRFDIRDGKRLEHWLVTFKDGNVSTIESNEEADCVVQTDGKTFAAVLDGRTNAMAAMLRGTILLEGKILLMGIFRKLLVAPIAAPDEIESAGYARRQS